jgi:pimeloyl-ACP methyl ester carboxylesterase
MPIRLPGATRTSRFRPAFVLLILAALFAPLAGSGEAQAASGRRPGHVYLFRGIFNVFSLGMDQIAYKLEAAGEGTTLANHTTWSSVADDIVAQYRAGNREPIILMGHSAGADATISVARKLAAANIPVALIVNFDPVSPDPVPNNVKQIVNYYVPAGWGQAVAPSDARYKGKIANIDESSTTNHFSVDKDDNLQRQAIARALAAAGGGGGHRKSVRSARSKGAQASAAPQ